MFIKKSEVVVLGSQKLSFFPLVMVLSRLGHQVNQYCHMVLH